MEVGCGDGGCAAAFERAGGKVIMMDIDPRLIAIANRLNAQEGIRAPAFVGDVFDDTADFYRAGPFDLVVLRDVVEHLASAADALQIIGRHLSEGGRLYVVFPPYYSPYGAHQQILPRKRLGPLPYNKLPWVQLLPERWFRALARGDSPQNAEVERLRGIRLTIGKFERAVKESGFEVERRKLYLSRPTFALRYGFPVLGAPLIGRVPILRELFVTAAYYLLRRRIRKGDPKGGGEVAPT